MKKFNEDLSKEKEADLFSTSPVILSSSETKQSLISCSSVLQKE